MEKNSQSNPLDLFKSAQKLYNENNFDQSIQALLQAEKLLDMLDLDQQKEYQFRESLYFNMAKCYLKLDQNEKANQRFQEALEYCNDHQKIKEINQQIELVKQNQEMSTLNSNIDPKRLMEGQMVLDMISKMDTLIKEGEPYYLIGITWFEQWQKYVYYDIIIKQDKKNQFKESERIHPGKIDNSDIILVKNKHQLQDYNAKTSWTNVQLKPRLKEQEHYIIVDETIFNNLKNIYDVRSEETIKRYGIQVNQETNECIVEIYLQQILIYPMPNQKVFNFSCPYSVYISRMNTIQNLQKKICNILFTYLYYVQKDKSTQIKQVRLWKSLTNKIEELKDYDKKYNNCSSVKVDAQLLEDEENSKLEDFNIAEEDIIIVETQKNNKFIFEQQLSKEQEQAEIKMQLENIKMNSAKLDEIKGQNLEKIASGGSRMGLTGLQNLGNTCYMNSGLQCLSNTIELTKYFCFNYHKLDINPDNPLGMGGKLALAYAGLIQEMWLSSNQRIAPWDVKKVVGKRVSKFSGFGQQDSCELMNYLLDILHEDLNRVKKKPYIEIENTNGRPDQEVSQEFWEGFLARNQSIIVDLMYGQLKSTVVCQACNNISITFDPFLTLSLPIPRPYKLEIYYIPYELTINLEDKIAKNEVSKLMIQAGKSDNIQGLKDKIKQIMINSQEQTKKSQKLLLDQQETQLIVSNFSMRLGVLMNKFRDTQSCYDIDQSKEDTFIYEVPKQQSQEDMFLIECLIMKPVRYGKTTSGDTISRVLPRLEYFKGSMNILDVKKFFIQKLQNFIKNPDELINSSIDSINEKVLIQIYDNLPYEQYGNYSRRKANCEFCQNYHGQSDTCDIIINKLSANSNEGCQKITIRDIYENMKNKRDIILGVIFRQVSGIQYGQLEPDFDTSHIQQMKKKKDADINLDQCLMQFSREEMLTGDDQWYCNKCKEHRDITKKLELFKLPKILIIQLKRFKSKKSNSGQSGFYNLAYAQICQQEKVSDMVNFPVEQLDMSSYLPSNGQPVIYDLYGVSNHFGSLHGGHYTAYAFNSIKGKWYEFNDSSVGSVGNPESVVTPGAYILFYRRRD